MTFAATADGKKVLKMDEYIKREAVKDLLKRYGAAEDALTLIDSIKASDVAPVAHGRWARVGIKGRKSLPIYPCCSSCGMVSAAFRSEWEGLRGPWKYCPNCGARMDKERKE